MKSLWHEIRCGNRLVDTFPSLRVALAMRHILDAIHPERHYGIKRAKAAPTQFAHDPRQLQGSVQVPAASLSAPPPAPSLLPTAADRWLSPRLEEQVHEQSNTDEQTQEKAHCCRREGAYALLH